MKLFVACVPPAFLQRFPARSKPLDVFGMWAHNNASIWSYKLFKHVVYAKVKYIVLLPRWRNQNCGNRGRDRLRAAILPPAAALRVVISRIVASLSAVAALPRDAFAIAFQQLLVALNLAIQKVVSAFYQALWW